MITPHVWCTMCNATGSSPAIKHILQGSQNDVNIEPHDDIRGMRGPCSTMLNGEIYIIGGRDVSDSTDFQSLYISF